MCLAFVPPVTILCWPAGHPISTRFSRCRISNSPRSDRQSNRREGEATAGTAERHLSFDVFFRTSHTLNHSTGLLNTGSALRVHVLSRFVFAIFRHGGGPGI